MTAKVTARDLSQRLASEIDAVVRDLGLKTKRRGRYLVCVPPWGSKPKLEIDAQKILGKWNDWEAGVSGDALGLVGCVLTCQPDLRTQGARLEGIRWARARYGLEGGEFDAEAWKANVEKARKRSAEAQRAANDALKRNRGVAEHNWIQADELRPTRFNGTVVEKGCAGARYLEARGIDFKHLGRIPRAVKLSPRERWVLMGDENQVLEEHFGPALMSRMDLHEGGFGSLHRIWINPDREGEKADLSPPRKMWPESEGTAIRLWRGANFLSETAAAAKGHSCPVVVCEGVEDGFSIAMMTPEYRVHVAGSLAGLRSYVPPACASKVIVAADNDWNKPQAVAQLKAALDRLRGLGKPIEVARAEPPFKDFNDMLMGRLA